MISSRVLFVVNEVAHYGEFKKILSSSGLQSKLNYLILFDRDGYDPVQLFSKEIKDCEENHLNYITLPRLANTEPTTTSGFLSQVLRQVQFYKTKLNTLQTFFESQQIKSVVLGEENILMDTFLYKKAFRKGLVVVYPYTIPNPQEMKGGAEIQRSKNSFAGQLINLLGGRFAKKIGHSIFLLLNPHKIAALFSIGYFPKNPWVLNSDTADFVCVESQKMSELYQRLGVQKSRLKVIGSFNDDILTRALINQPSKKLNFQKKYNLLANKPIILVAFPPSQFPLKSAEHASYDELMQSWSKTLQPFLSEYSIVITKHPRTNQSFESMSNLGFTFANESTVELIPFACLYIASVSATIRWALAAGVPVINYDTYRYKYSDYNNVIGVSTVYSEIDFKKQLIHTLTDSSYYADLKKNLGKESNLWGVLDGKVSERFMRLLDSENSKGD